MNTSMLKSIPNRVVQLTRSTIRICITPQHLMSLWMMLTLILQILLAQW